MPGDTQTAARRLDRQHRETTTPSAGHHQREYSPYHSTSIQDRILQWQAQGVAALPPDALSVVSTSRTVEQESLAASRPTTPGEDIETPVKNADRTPRGRASRRMVEAEQEQWIRKGRASTPRKRVVSDDHWRKSHTKSGTPTRERQSPTIVNEVSPVKHDKKRSSGEARTEREERRRRRIAARAKENQSRFEDNKSRTVEVQCQEQHHERLSAEIQSNVGNRTGYDSERDDFSDGQCDWGSNPDRDHDNVLINSQYAATLGRPQEYAQRSSVRIKSKMLSKTKEMLGINETAHTAPEFVTSIEAWLDEQADPFVDQASTAHLPKRREHRTKQRTKSEQLPSGKNLDRAAEPTFTMSESNPDGDGNSYGKLHNSTGSFTPPATTAIGRSSVMPKRRGARSTRVGRHTLTGVLHGDEVFQETLQTNGHHPNQRDSTPLLLTAKPALDTNKDNKRDPNCSLQRRLTTHQDLMSELSRPGRSRRTRRTQASRPEHDQQAKEAIERILASIKQDEVQYTRELRTLVDGVVPVLLQCVLSKNDAVANAILFTANDDETPGKQIVDMGIALERLKSLHNRLPSGDVEKLLPWCQTAHRSYTDYLKAWKLGFQDVVVNLAPLENGKDDDGDIMARDNEGDVVGADGEKVDVAYLLKRPLIKIRKMNKALNELAEVLKDHPIARKIADDYVELTAQAKAKHQQEQGRLEDEAATQIDATKTRDIRTLSALPGVNIGKGRRVRARDSFNLTLQHSTGQRMDCKVELILRDNKDGSGSGGDVLICQIEEGGKWLLFAPVAIANVSARREASGCDLVVMLRGRADLRGEWHELLALQTDEGDVVTDWLNMLGSNPLPPKLKHVEQIMDQHAMQDALPRDVVQGLTAEALAQVSNHEVDDIPLGEPSVLDVKPRTAHAAERKKVDEKPLPKLSLGGGLQQKLMPQRWLQTSVVPVRKPVGSPTKESSRHRLSQASPGVAHDLPPVKKHNPSQLSSSSTISTQPYSAQSSVVGASIVSDSTSNVTQSTFAQSASSATSFAASEHSVRRTKHVSLALPVAPPTARQDHQRRVSIATGHGDGSSPKTRDAPARKSFSTTPLTETLREKWASMSGWGKKTTTATQPIEMSTATSSEVSIEVPKPPEHKTRRGLPDLSNPLLQDKVERVSEPIQHLSATLPDRTVTRQKPDLVQPSPLKVEYEASSATETPEEYDSDSTDDSSSSEISQDHGSEMRDDLRSLPDMKRKRPMSRPPPVWKTAPSTTGTHTLAPSDSASQGPYRSVPSSSAYPEAKKEWCAAMVCTWSDTGVWEPLQNEDCAILISPGLIEAFPASVMHDHHNPMPAPLVAFELTPIVPLRKGTALDITIRSPPTANSRIRTTNNAMFRSRTAMNCEKLYHMINWARCNNPTYMELERARPKLQPVVTFGTQQPERPRSWFSFGGPRRRNSYRAGSMPPSTANSAASTGSGMNALAAIKRFSKGSAFSIQRSSVVRRPGRGTNQSLYSVDTNTASGSGGSVPAPSTQNGFVPGKDGPNVPETSAEAVNGGGMVNNMKIKLFLRQGQNWKPLGPSRLSVLPAPITSTPGSSRPGSSSGSTHEDANAIGASRRTVSLPGTPRREYRLPSSNHTPHRIHGNGREKRILITRKDRPDIVLLDETLGESCFEKVAERGIAVKVWTEEEMMRNQGGVLTGRGRLYMMQFSGQSEATWVFGLCGSYRYGANPGEN